MNKETIRQQLETMFKQFSDEEIDINCSLYLRTKKGGEQKVVSFDSNRTDD